VEHLAVTAHTLNFVEGEGISVQTGPNPGDPAVLDVEIANTVGGLLDAKGDLLTATDTDLAARLPVGADGQVLTADSTADTGIAWADPAGGGGGGGASPADTACWLPLTSTVSGDDVLVFDADHSLIPTLVSF
jgi:hypothetical protein